MQTASRPPAAASAEHGSRTMTITSTPARDGASPQAGSSNLSPEKSDQRSGAQEAGTLRLRARPIREQRVQWDEEVIDNEGMGKKKSKICCIYRKPRAFDESSDESSSASDSDSPCDHRGHRHNHHSHSHPHRNEAVGSGSSRAQGSNAIQSSTPAIPTTAEQPKPQPNAYEVEPGAKKGKGKSLDE